MWHSRHHCQQWNFYGVVFGRFETQWTHYDALARTREKFNINGKAETRETQASTENTGPGSKRSDYTGWETKDYIKQGLEIVTSWTCTGPVQRRETVTPEALRLGHQRR